MFQLSITSSHPRDWWTLSFQNCPIELFPICRIWLLYNKFVSLSNGKGWNACLLPISVRLSTKISHIREGITAGLSTAHCSKNKDKADETLLGEVISWSCGSKGSGCFHGMRAGGGRCSCMCVSVPWSHLHSWKALNKRWILLASHTHLSSCFSPHISPV